jgi:hypothetical protein
MASSYVIRWHPSLVGRSGDTSAVGAGEAADGDTADEEDGEGDVEEGASSPLHPASASTATSRMGRTKKKATPGPRCAMVSCPFTR